MRYIPVWGVRCGNIILNEFVDYKGMSIPFLHYKDIEGEHRFFLIEYPFRFSFWALNFHLNLFIEFGHGQIRTSGNREDHYEEGMTQWLYPKEECEIISQSNTLLRITTFYLN